MVVELKPVTPHTGVWIETYFVYHIVLKLKVTPHTGVWIETGIAMPCMEDLPSRPTRACGLKLDGLALL